MTFKLYLHYFVLYKIQQNFEVFRNKINYFSLIRIYTEHFLQTTIHRHIPYQSSILKWNFLKQWDTPMVCNFKQTACFKSQRGNPKEVFPRLRCYFNSNWYKLQWELDLTYRPSLEPEWGLLSESKSTYWLRRYELTFYEQRNDSVEDKLTFWMCILSIL